MPRVSHVRRPSRKGGNEPSTQAPPPFTDAPSQTPPATQTRRQRRQYIAALSQDPARSTDAPPPTQASLPVPLVDATSSSQISPPLIDTVPSTEAPSQAPPATQTRQSRFRQCKKAPSQPQPPSVNTLSSTQAPPSSIGAPSSSQVPPPLIDVTLSTEAPLQAPPVSQPQRSRYRHSRKAPSRAQPPSANTLPSTQIPPSSFGAPSSSQVPTSPNVGPSTQAPLTLINASISLIDATPSTEVPSQSPLVAQSTPPTEASSQSLPVTQSPPSAEAPSQSQPVTQTQSKSRQSTRFWTVDVEDASGVKVAHLKLKDLWELPNGTKVVLPLNDCKQPVGEAGGLLGQALGELGADFAALPICYKSWLKVPNSYKEVIYNSKIKEKFIINDPLVKKIIIKRIGEKWKDNRSEVFHRYYDSKLSREENYANHPSKITRDQWIQFLEYRLDPNTVKMCERNAQSREKLLVVHRGGSKTLARKRFEMEVEGGEPVSRGKVFIATHVGADGSYANPETQAICEKIMRVESEGNCSKEIGPNDSLGQVLGKEHPGRLRGVGFGPCKSQVAGTQQMQSHDEDGSSSCLNSASFAQMQQDIVGLRAQLEAETKSRVEFQNALSLVLQHLSTPFMTPELGSILTPILATCTSDGDDGQSNESSDHD